METCRVENCNDKIVNKTNVLCGKHYHRLQRHGDVNTVLKVRNKDQGCSVPDCDNKHYGKGYCQRHYQRMRNSGTTDDPSFKGRWKTKAGYIELRPPESDSCKEKVMEHRYVMECYLGRKLYQHENVHHKNGVRDDNRLENLELWSSYQPSGQRVEDKLAYAYEIIKLYGPTENVEDMVSKGRARWQKGLDEDF